MFFGFLYIIIVLLGGFIFPLLYIFCNISWVHTICIVYAGIYALFSILGGDIIPYLIVFFIGSIILKIQGNDNYWLLSFVEVPFLISIYCLINGYYKGRKMNTSEK